MRTENASPLVSTLARLRARLSRLGARAPVGLGRWPIVLAALVAMVSMGYVAIGTGKPAGGFVRSGERFSADDLTTIKRALATGKVPFAVDAQGRVEVATDRLDDANGIVAKLDVGPRTFSEIDKRMLDQWSILDTSEIKTLRVEQARNDELAQLIRPLPGIVSARVWINRPKARGLARPAQAWSAFVSIETEGDRRISPRTLQLIQELISSYAPDVKHDAVSVFDRTGYHYLDAKDPAVGALARSRAREEELREEIAHELDCIKGVEVSVHLAPGALAAPIVPPPRPQPTHEPPPPPGADEVRLGEPLIGVNQPLELLEDEPRRPGPSAKPIPEPLSQPTPAVDASIQPRQVRVWVKVPRSYYLNAMPNREPSLEDLQPLVGRTELLIKTAVTHVVPPGQLGELSVSTIPDELPAPTSAPPASTDSRYSLGWWVPAGMAGAATAVILVVFFRVVAVRRPTSGPSRNGGERRGRYTIDEASEAGRGPSERVRELIRLDPEAAASVLHRWAGRGGTIG
jgi:flagellar biosynthesis/type III secretory pathway M-ring protein FliF/YscJ